jgi:hypothetical protein
MSARAIHIAEYAVLAVILAVVAFAERDQLGAAFWILLVGPDLALVVAPALGRMPGGGRLPPRAVPLYNAFHSYVPLFAVALVLGYLRIDPTPLLGWAIHISADRAMTFGLRGPDGGQALI